jgi:spore maturation protein SpmA
MLNWIWLGLITIAIGVAASRDISELTSDRFRNGQPITIERTGTDIVKGFITKHKLQEYYGATEAGNIDTISLTFDADAEGTIVAMLLPSDPPKVWKDAATALGDEKKIPGRAVVGSNTINFTPEPVRFRILAKVVSDGVIKMAEVSVTLAIGLVGIMAFWLGIMKIAEAAGLVTLLAKMAKPIMVRLFPDVPPEHPAMGAMLSNMAANFLGLSNAATPLGLKAMEELNKLNPKSGTATNAMCTFLTMNTAAITLVPTTVIAVRASLGSKDPTDILVPTFIAALLGLVLGLVFNRMIQRFFPVR